MSTNGAMLGASVFLLIITGLLITNFDATLCPEITEWTNTSTTETEISVSWKDYIWGSKCSGLPNWYKLLIYTPFIIMAIRSTYP